MSRTVRFTENETGIEVDVEVFETWGPLNRLASVAYPAAIPGGPRRKYGLPEAEIAKYFTIVSPQEVFLTAFGGVYDRPTKKQSELKG